MIPRVTWHASTWPMLQALYALSRQPGRPSHNTLINIAVRRLARDIEARGLPAIMAEEAAVAVAEQPVWPPPTATTPTAQS
jgi:hypothetical protein